jgi:glutathione S-transferase
VTAGTVVSSLHLVGLSLDNHPKLSAWLENLNQRPAWVNSLPTQEAMEKFKSSRSNG